MTTAIFDQATQAVALPEPLSNPGVLSGKVRQAALVSALAPCTAVHPAPIVISLAAAVWFVSLSWLFFASDTETRLPLAIVTIIFCMYLGGMTWGAVMSQNTTPEQVGERSFAAFLDGDVDISTGIISGREAMIQIAFMPVALAVGGTIIALSWAFIR